MIPYVMPPHTGSPSDHYRVSIILDSLGSSLALVLLPWCADLIDTLDAHYNQELHRIYFKTEEDLVFFKLSIPT